MSIGDNVKVYNNIVELIGETPIIRLKKYEKLVNSKAKILVKVESFNPLGSVKDRVALAMINSLETKKMINKDTVLVEPTSGNTGIGLAFVCASKGYPLIITMPDTMSKERIMILEALGAKVILTPGEKGMSGAISYANKLVEENNNYIMPQQFENPANPEIHRASTAQEILRDTDGVIDYFVSGIGTGGTITGVGEVLKETLPSIRIIGVEPLESPIISKGTSGPHKLQGIGAGFIPKVLNTKIIDEMILVAKDDAFQASRSLAKTEGILAGISSGAALHAGTTLAQKLENAGKTILIILPDTGERYLTTDLFNESK